MIPVMNSNEMDLDRNPSDLGDTKDKKNDVVLSEEIRASNGDDRLGDKASDSDEIRVSKDGNAQEIGSLKEIEEKFSDGNGGSERNESKTSVRKVKSEKSGLKSKKGSVKREKMEKEEKGSSVSQYDSMLSMFDEFAANGGGGTEDGVVGHGYEVGDMVWGKVKSHPWWPGHVYNEEFALPSVRRSKTEENVLVAFFGDSSYGWFDPAELVPFDSSFVEKSRQTSSRTFVKAVEEAVDEANRRCALGLACRCRNEFNFGVEKVPGYFTVDIPNYEPNMVYSENLIRKSRDSFQPREMLDFVKKLALTPTSNEHGSIHFMKNKATAVAYRTVVYDEFDETYALAFGHQPVRPSKQTQDEASTRAPLSGPLVIAEALGKAKCATKPHKSKDHTKKDRYLFKRRDEPNELKPGGEIHQDQGTPSGQQVYVDSSLPIASGDYILQRRSPSISSNHEIAEKLEQAETVTGDSVSDLGHHVIGKEGMTIDKKPVVVEFSMDGAPGQLSHPLEARSTLVKGEEDIPSTIDVGVATDLDDHGSSSISKPAKSFVQSQAAETKVEGEPSQDAGVTASPLLRTAEAKVHVEGPKVRTGNATKKTKIRKREAAQVDNENSISLAKKKKKKKELMSSQGMQTNPSAGKAKAKVEDIPGNSVHVPMATEGDMQVDPMKKGDTVGTSFLPGSVVFHKMAQMKELDLPQLLHDLQFIALDPFYNLDRGTSAVTQEVFLRFRSLVYQKSLPSLPPADSESNESRVKPQAVVTSNNPPAAENVREPSFKPQKTVVRPDDPTKGGWKRGPSDRQEDIAAKKKKKISDMKILTTDKKAALKTSALPRADIKETSGPTAKSVKHTPLKRPEPTSRAPEPTTLVMKFPPQGTLPSPMELKARFARFGQMDHSATRIFWKTSMCRIVYRYKADAEAALRFASGNSNLFGNTGVRCFIKEVEVAAPEPEPVKLQREESSMGMSQSRPVVMRRMTPAPLKSQVLQQQAGGQLKSILKKSTGDEASGNGGGKGNPRVKFMLGGDENSRGGEELMIGGNKNFNKNTSFADGTSSTSTSHHEMDFYSKNVVVPPSTLPLLPLPPTSAVQFPIPQNNLHYTELEPPRNAHNFNVPPAPPTTHSIQDADISQQMMTLLTKCNDVVRNLTSYLGYVPYHPL